MPTLPIGSGRGRGHSFCDPSLDFERRRPGDGSRLVFAALQDGLRNIVAPSPAALGRVARAHPVAAVIEQLAGEERVRVLAIAGRALSMLRKQKLHSVPCLLINDGIVKTIVGLALVGQPPKEAHGEFESECPGYCGAQDTFYVGNMKGVGRIYQQTFIDTYAKVAHAKLYDRKTPITAADLVNDRVVPFYDAREVRLCRVLTDRGTEYCGNPEHHEYELYLALEDIDHSRTKTKSPQTNGIVERFHKTVLDEFYRIAFRKKIYGSIADLQVDLDRWVQSYNEERPHQGRWCFGKTPMQTFLDATPLAKEKMIAA